MTDKVRVDPENFVVRVNDGPRRHIKRFQLANRSVTIELTDGSEEHYEDADIGRIPKPGPHIDPRLGRHQVHDERSRAYALEAVALPTVPVLHQRHRPIFDQGSLGSCTANAALGMLSTGPLWDGQPWTEADCIKLYSEETLLDDAEIPGHYPPDDTGSAGIYSCKALKNRKLITKYQHAFSLTTALGWLGRQPISIGIPWLESMFTPGKGALLTVDRRSAVAGGHQVCVDGIEPARSRVRIANSWGPSWGDHGWCWMTYADLGWLLAQGGDAVTVTL